MDGLRIKIPVVADFKVAKTETQKFIEKYGKTPIQLKIETATGVATQEMTKAAKSYEKIWEKAFFKQRQDALQAATAINNAYSKQFFSNFNTSLGIGNVAKSAKDSADVFQNLFTQSNNAARGLSSVENQTLKLNPEIKALGANTEKSAQSLTSIIGKFSQWYLIAGLVTTTIGTLKSSITTIYDIDTAITNLKKVSEELGTTVGIKEFTKDMNDMAIEVGHSTTAAIESVADFKRLGYTLQEAQTLARQALIYSNVSDQNIADATQSIISTLKGFSMSVDDVSHVIDAYNEVDLLLAS